MSKVISNITYMKNVQWFRDMYTIKNATNPIDNKIEVLFKSKNYLILNKPADLICYNFNKNKKNTPSLYDYLREQFPFYYDPRITGGFHVLHRLDSVTSGVICVPLNYFSQRLAGIYNIEIFIIIIIIIIKN
jgi:23S rRNA-/tRNA-specific pseudouridylate synthase